MQWHDIEKALPTFTEATGGYSTARRGMVTLADGRQAFVKIGTDEYTNTWTRKEIAAYTFLQQQNFVHAPRLLATKPDNTAFAIEFLPPTDGWDWSATWSNERLDTTLAAMNDLAGLAPQGSDKAQFEVSFISETADGWQPLAASGELQDTLGTKLIAAQRPDIADHLDFAAMAKQSARFALQRNALVHNDIRADNCAWNEGLRQVRLIDWNWVQLGDRRLDIGMLCAHVYGSGFTLDQKYLDMLDAAALQWLAGFWFKAALTPITGKAERAVLREHQLRSGIAALDLAAKL